MADEIDRLIKNSNKAELIEQLTDALATYYKVIVVLVQDKEKGGYSSLVMTLGVNNTYEAYGILEVGKQDLIDEDRVR